MSAPAAVLEYAHQFDSIVRMRWRSKMTPEDNKAIVRRWFAALDMGDRAILDELCAPDYRDHSPPLPDLPCGRAGVRRALDI